MECPSSEGTGREQRCDNALSAVPLGGNTFKSNVAWIPSRLASGICHTESMGRKDTLNLV